ncbi:MAG TPA: C4-type zinc ribbon domain-containing protein [Terriglobia bacterium]|nr:C4-type zinc ribbon domain-containing protein [Terriglobia bacterium]
MNSDLKQLIRLQAIDLSIQELRARVDRFPGISKALDEKLRSAQAGLETAREKVKSNQAGRKKYEGEISSTESKISKYRDQMMAVKTNDEYRALQHEIDHAQKGKRKTEDDLLNLMMEAESLQSEIKTAEALLKEDQQKVHEERKLLEEENKRDLSALESYVKERKEIEASITSDDLLPRYERVRKHRGGIAVAAARNEVCEICKVRIRPQVFQEVRKNNQIIACDNCQRILYDPENLDHPFEVA